MEMETNTAMKVLIVSPGCFLARNYHQLIASTKSLAVVALEQIPPPEPQVNIVKIVKEFDACLEPAACVEPFYEDKPRRYRRRFPIPR